MPSNAKSDDEYLAQLKGIEENGISGDSKKLKQNMSSQGSDPRTYLREIVTNSSDAGAQRVRIQGQEYKGNLEITLSDDGHGMNRQGLLDWGTLFRSRKTGDPAHIHGRFGVGKTVVAAIPGMNAFSLETSDGKEAWCLEATSLIDDSPITIRRVTPVPPPGTCIKVSFEADGSLADELAALREVIERDLRYLPIQIIIDQMDGDRLRPQLFPTRDWGTISGSYGQVATFELDGLLFEAVMELGTPCHELYQARVFVTDRYDLLSHDLPDSFTVPHVHIRIESPAFELPFGRHGLMNEDLLGPLSTCLRQRLLREFMRRATRDMAMNTEYGTGPILDFEIYAIACSLLRHVPTEFAFLRSLPMFQEITGRRYSIEELEAIVAEHGVLYLDDNESSGIDYEAFGAPVLSQVQPTEGLQLLKEIFKENIVNLAVKDIVFEAPISEQTKLGEKELRFQAHLAFDPDVIEHARSEGDPSEVGNEYSAAELRRIAGACQEASAAQLDLGCVRFRVNYLVHNDGKRPCRTQRFLVKDDECVLNLNHPEVEQLRDLSEIAPELAGHFGLAMSLQDTTQRLLPHVSDGAREDLVKLDGIAKCHGNTAVRPLGEDEDEDEDWQRQRRRFLRMLREQQQGF